MKRFGRISLLIGIGMSAVSCATGPMEQGKAEYQAGNKTQAKSLFEKACDSGDMQGCYREGLVEEESNWASALYDYKKACDGGVLDACINAGDLDRKHSDKAEAKNFYEKVCHAGLQTGCFDLAELSNELAAEPKPDTSEKKSELTSRIEAKYNMPLCSVPELFNVLYSPAGGTVESGCVYILHGPLKAIQSIEDGILVSLVQPMRYLPDKVFFIKTDKPYTDQQLVGNILVHSTGIKKYQTVLGVESTIDSFKYLGDATFYTR